MAHPRNWKKPAWGMKGQGLRWTQDPEEGSCGQGRAVSLSRGSGETYRGFIWGKDRL